MTHITELPEKCEEIYGKLSDGIAFSIDKNAADPRKLIDEAFEKLTPAEKFVLVSNMAYCRGEDFTGDLEQAAKDVIYDVWNDQQFQC